MESHCTECGPAASNSLPTVSQLLTINLAKIAKLHYLIALRITDSFITFKEVLYLPQIVSM